MDNKPILCLDFDGVMNSYVSGWKGAAVIPDDPVPGLFEFLEEAKEHFEIHVLSSRSHQPGGVEAMMVWFLAHRKKWRENGGKGSKILDINFPKTKPPAMVTIDDRALQFTGTWPDIEKLKNFKPWHKL